MSDQPKAVHVTVSVPGKGKIASWTTTEDGEHIPDAPVVDAPDLDALERRALQHIRDVQENRQPKPDPKVIFLAPECAARSSEGRCWSDDGAPGCECGQGCEPTRYVIASQPVPASVVDAPDLDTLERFTPLIDGKMQRIHDGEWVKHDDAFAALRTKDAETERLREVNTVQFRNHVGHALFEFARRVLTASTQAPPEDIVFYDSNCKALIDAILVEAYDAIKGVDVSDFVRASRHDPIALAKQFDAERDAEIRAPRSPACDDEDWHLIREVICEKACSPNHFGSAWQARSLALIDRIDAALRNKDAETERLPIDVERLARLIYSWDQSDDDSHEEYAKYRDVYVEQAEWIVKQLAAEIRASRSPADFQTWWRESFDGTDAAENINSFREAAHRGWDAALRSGETTPTEEGCPCCGGVGKTCWRCGEGLCDSDDGHCRTAGPGETTPTPEQSCSTCRGSGTDSSANPPESCDACGGSGKRSDEEGRAPKETPTPTPEEDQACMAAWKWIEEDSHNQIHTDPSYKVIRRLWSALAQRTGWRQPE